MKFLGQCFQKLEHEQDRQTDATERITQPHSFITNEGTYPHPTEKNAPVF